MTHTRLVVDGMSCEACSVAVQHALRLPGVSQVEVKLDTGVVDVAHTAATSVEALVGAIEDTGYEVQEAPSG